MQTLLDMLASGIHDAKNQLFQAETGLIAAEAQHGIDLGETRYAIEAAARRLNRMLTTCRLERQEIALAIVPVVIEDLLAEVQLTQQPHVTRTGLQLQVDAGEVALWPMDRELVGDMLNNAVQNAARYARRQIRLHAREVDGGLCLHVEDDGAGYETLPPASGTGLQLARRLAHLHQRHGRTGHLTLANDGPLGGARFTLWLP